MERVQIRGLPEGDYQVQCKTKDNWEKLSQTILPDCRSGGSIDAYYEFTKDGQWHINGSKVQDVEEVTYEDWKEAIETHIRRVGDFKVGDLVYITKGYFDLKKGDVPALEGFDGTHWWIKTKEYPKIFLDKDENFRHATPEEIAASASVSPSNIMVTKDNAVVGLEVVRGRDWDYGDQDHFKGKPSVGTIAMEYGYFPNNKNSGWVKVKWKGGSTDSYEIGTDLDDDGKYDLYVYQGSTEPVQQPVTPTLSKREGKDPLQIPVGWKPGDSWRHKDIKCGLSISVHPKDDDFNSYFVDYGENGTAWVTVKGINDAVATGVWIINPEQKSKEKEKEESQTIIISKQTNTKTKQDENIKESNIGNSISITEQCFISSSYQKSGKTTYVPGDEERITAGQRRKGSAVRG
jgi:hypothetical protein